MEQLEREADKLGLSYVNISKVLGSNYKVLKITANRGVVVASD